MVPVKSFLGNLRIIEKYKHTNGDVVECGVWRGGMIASIATILGNTRTYHLFDSFEGLPPAKEIDGESALIWQKNKDGDFYFDNCAAKEDFAIELLTKIGVEYAIHKGWFNETIPLFQPEKPIDILRLDADWYDSTFLCLEHFYPSISKGGIIIIDDYYTWDGCSRAVHDYLSKEKSDARIFMGEGFAYIIKQ